MRDFDPIIQEAARRYNLDPDVFRRQLIRESGLNPNARNGKSGAAGIAQFMPATARGLGIDPMDPAQAIPAAARYMRQNLDHFGGDLDHALAAYNWGPGNVMKHGLGNMPAETRNYIAAIRGGSPMAAAPTPADDALAMPPPPPPEAQPQPQATASSLLLPPEDPEKSGLADAFFRAAKQARGFV